MPSSGRVHAARSSRPGERARIACEAAVDFWGGVEAELGGNIAVDKADVVGFCPKVVTFVRAP